MIADATGIGAIAGLLTVVASGALWWLQRRASKNDDPKNQATKSKNENANAIATDTDGARLDAELDRLHKPPGS